VPAPLPGVAELTAVSTVGYAGTVRPEYIDGNGHMNIVRYLEVNSLAVERLIEDDAGLDVAHRAAARTSIFTAEHHLTYYSELLAGDPFSVHAVVVERSNRALHMMTYLVDPVRAVIANTLEILAVHVSLDTRRAVPFLPDTAQRIDAMLDAQRSWTWRPDGCGAFGLRTTAVR
jgi:acyl-CoA thioester hydrolase